MSSLTSTKAAVPGGALHAATASAAAAAAATAKVGRKSASLPPETVEYLKSWMMSPEHVAHPYPTEQEKAQIMAETGIELKQLTNWFVNNRKRYWKPRVEAKLQKFNQQQQQGTGGAGATATLSPGGGLSATLPAFAASVHKSQPAIGTAAPSSSLVAPVAAPSASLLPPPLVPRGPPHGGVRPGAVPPAGPPSPHLGPAALAGALSARLQGRPLAGQGGGDPHTVSEGSASSSACNSDDDSVDAGVTGSPAGPRLSLGLASVPISTSMPPSPPGGQHAPGGAGYCRREEVDVHVLRPESPRPGSPPPDGGRSPLPTLRDLTIKASVPRDRILATFKCPISYTIPYEIEHDRKKVQSRRDGEVLRVKKHYLRLYLATRGIHSAGDGTTAASPPPAAPSPTHVASAAVVGTGPARPRDGAEDVAAPPAKRARPSAVSPGGEDVWRSLCQNATGPHCETLPGLEEAARMFGYVSQ